MIKDISVNLEHQIARDRLAILPSPLRKLSTYMFAGVAFAHIPEFPGYVGWRKFHAMVAETEKALEPR